jgi:hypothetical protein
MTLFFWGVAMLTIGLFAAYVATADEPIDRGL